MISFLKKYSILIVLSVLVIILVFLKVFYSKKNETVAPIVITPTEIPAPTSFELDSLDINPDESQDLILPYAGKKMMIIGYKEPGVLEILIKKEEDKPAAQEEFNQWLKKYPNFESDTFVFTIEESN